MIANAEVMDSRIHSAIVSHAHLTTDPKAVLRSTITLYDTTSTRIFPAHDNEIKLIQIV